MALAPMFTDLRPMRRRATAPQLRVALVIHAEILFVALEHAGARVSDGRWIEPLHHRRWPPNPNNRTVKEI